MRSKKERVRGLVSIEREEEGVGVKERERERERSGDKNVVK